MSHCEGSETEPRKLRLKRRFVFEASKVEYESVVLEPADDRRWKRAERCRDSLKDVALAPAGQRTHLKTRTRNRARR